MTLYLADTSAWNRSTSAADRWERLAEGEELAICTPVLLELLYPARGKRDHSRLSADLRAGFRSLAMGGRAEALALRTQAALGEKSQHRGPKPMDVLVAAIAEAHGAVVLHYDRHFDAIARATGQPMEWLAPRGSLD